MMIVWALVKLALGVTPLALIALFFDADRFGSAIDQAVLLFAQAGGYAAVAVTLWHFADQAVRARQNRTAALLMAGATTKDTPMQMSAGYRRVLRDGGPTKPRKNATAGRAAEQVTPGTAPVPVPELVP